MSTLVKEMRGTAAQGQTIPAVMLGGSSQKVNFTGTSAQSTALGANTSLVMLHATEDCWVAMGADPTAAATGVGSMFLPANQSYHAGVTPGLEIAVVQDSAGGSLYIYECP